MKKKKSAENTDNKRTPGNDRALKKNILIEEETACGKEDPAPPDNGFPIVGIGASAGGLAAFEAFFSSMPADKNPGMAFVLVQHLAPDHKSILTELIQRYTDMRVFEVTDGMVVKPDCAYIIPPNRDMAFRNGVLQLLEPTAPRGQRMPIDFFFRSLARDQRERAICIVLSGTGSDGTLGIRAIKGEGGMVMVQSPESTEYDGMPRNAIATGLVDYELTPEKMPDQLKTYIMHAFGKLPRTAFVVPPHIDTIMKKIFTLLRIQTGHDFSLYKPSTIHRRIERRMALHQIEKIEEYAEYLQQTSAEVESLLRDLLIGVTSFFRDPEAFRFLQKHIIPQFFKGKPAGSTVRIWSPGCSTGEEAYSLAILVQEYLEEAKQNYKVQIFATDIDSQAITTARTGFYPASIAADISSERLARFFIVEHDNSAYRVHKNIRDMLIFSEQDVIKDPPFSRLDLISCRNLLIYMGGDLQKKLIPLFHYALLPGGFLFLGSSETVGEFDDLFAVLDRKLKLYQRKENVHGMQRFSPGQFFLPSKDTIEIPARIAGKTAFSGRLPLRELTEQTLLQHVELVGVLVNDHGDILYFHGRAGIYLEPAQGEAGVNNILKMSREGLRRELTTALHKAVGTKEVVYFPGLRVKTNGDFVTVNLTIRPVAASPAAGAADFLYLVILEEKSSLNSVHYNESPANGSQLLDADTRIEALIQELRAKEEYLQAANEELETSNEELKCSNEEMQSVNEELQSTNEELETSKEELQSTNEELATVNAELQSKVVELSKANNDMNNLLAGTGIGTVFVDHALRILRFTPTVTRIINLIISDMGRPVGHIVSNLVGYDSLVADIQEVLDTLVPKEMEVQVKEGRWYTLRILPYRTQDNVIEGAVINFVDITEAKKMQEALLETRAILNAALDNSQVGIVITDVPDGAIKYENEMGKLICSGGSRNNTVETGINQYLSDWQLTDMEGRQLLPEEEPLAHAMLSGESCSRELVIKKGPDQKYIVLAKSAPVKDNNGKIIAGIAVIMDITDRKLADEKIKNLLTEKEIILREVHHRIKNNMGTIYSLLILQARTTKDLSVATALEDAGNRVQSMMVLYNTLFRSVDFEKLSVKDYLSPLVNTIIANFPGRKQVRVEKKIDDFVLDVTKLQPLGIIMNELITNCMKYAFADKEEGLIIISATLNGNQVFFAVQDNGGGIPESVDFEDSPGFGLTLVNMLATQLKGTIRLERDNGTKVILEFEK